jgi:hypothetical protein
MVRIICGIMDLKKGFQLIKWAGLSDSDKMYLLFNYAVCF